VSISCWTRGLLGDGSEADDKDGLEDGEPGVNTEVVRARRGIHRTREAGYMRETSFIMQSKEWTLSRRLGRL